MSFEAHVAAVYWQSTAMIALLAAAITLVGLWLWAMVERPVLRTSVLIVVVLAIAASPFVVSEVINARIVVYSAIGGRARFEPGLLTAATPSLLSAVIGVMFFWRRRRQRRHLNGVAA